MAIESPMDRVDDRELQAALVNQFREWRKSGDALERTLTFADFKSALEFVNAVGDKAELIGHHPDIDIRYNQVKLNLTSHDIGGISRRDLILAGYVDEVAPRYQTKKTA